MNPLTMPTAEDFARERIEMAWREGDFCRTCGQPMTIEVHRGSLWIECASLRSRRGIRLRLARLKPDTAVVLKADGVLDRVGSEQIHGNVHRAVEAELNAVRELQPG